MICLLSSAFPPSASASTSASRQPPPGDTGVDTARVREVEDASVTSSVPAFFETPPASGASPSSTGGTPSPLQLDEEDEGMAADEGEHLSLAEGLRNFMPDRYKIRLVVVYVVMYKVLCELESPRARKAPPFLAQGH